jgi:hypothetical protein
VKAGSIIKCLALAAVIPLIGAGCAGIATTQTISPLMFFLPGLVDTKPNPPQTIPVTQVASERDLSQLN